MKSGRNLKSYTSLNGCLSIQKSNNEGYKPVWICMASFCCSLKALQESHRTRGKQRTKSEGGGEGREFFFFFLSFRSNLGFTHVNPTWVNGNGSDCCAGQLRHPVSSRFFCFVFPWSPAVLLVGINYSKYQGPLKSLNKKFKIKFKI